MMIDNLFEIVIVNFNSTDLTISCIDSIRAQAPKTRIRVLDNNSQDNPKRIEGMFNSVFLEISKRNVGFSRAANRGLSKCNTPYVVLLNPDTILCPNFFIHITQVMSENPKIGVLGPKVLNSDGSVQPSARRFPNPLSAIWGRASLLTRLFPDNNFVKLNFLSNFINTPSLMPVDWVSGACMVIRFNILRDVGYLDERFFMYWEDVDLCRKVWGHGYKVIYCTLPAVLHHVAGSSRQRRLRCILDFHFSCFRYLQKYSPETFPFWAPLVLSGLAMRCLTKSFYALLESRN